MHSLVLEWVVPKLLFAHLDLIFCQIEKEKQQNNRITRFPYKLNPY